VVLGVLKVLLDGVDDLVDIELLVGVLALIPLFLEPPPLWARQTEPNRVKAIKKTIFFIII
jgi:hypothetical protein